MARPTVDRVKTFLSLRVRRRVANLPISQRRLAAHGEEEVITRWLGRLGQVPRVSVDIAASDGVDQSNTFFLFRDGWAGLAVEGDPVRFRALAGVHRTREQVGLARVFVTPANVCPLLRAYAVPHEFGLLSLDIDGYDHFVLEALLEEFRPRLIVAEINEKIPPPLRFTIRADAGYQYRGDHFYGQSLSQLTQLARRCSYDLVELNYNNAFLAPREAGLGVALDDAAAYRAGYADRPDRRERFAYNADMEPLQTLPPEKAAAWLREKFRGREREYLLEVP